MPTEKIRKDYDDIVAQMFCDKIREKVPVECQLEEVCKKSSNVAHSRVLLTTKRQKFNIYIRGSISQAYEHRSTTPRDYSKEKDLYQFTFSDREKKYLREEFCQDGKTNMVALVCINPEEKITNIALIPHYDLFCRKCKGRACFGKHFMVKPGISNGTPILRARVPMNEGEYHIHVWRDFTKYLTSTQLPIMPLTRNDPSQPIPILKSFLQLSHRSDAVLNRFRRLENAQYFQPSDNPKERFVYIPASRKNPVLLVAHADTFDLSDRNQRMMRCDPCFDRNRLHEEEGVIRNADRLRLLGADDRAGCALCEIIQQ